MPELNCRMGNVHGKSGRSPLQGAPPLPPYKLKRRSVYTHS